MFSLVRCLLVIGMQRSRIKYTSVRKDLMLKRRREPDMKIQKKTGISMTVTVNLLFTDGKMIVSLTRRFHFRCPCGLNE
jgi:hypothetical protein